MQAVQAEKVHFTKEKETMLITLYARAMQSRAPQPILSDPWAEEAISHIDHDFEKFKAGQRSSLIIASRAVQLDLWTKQFLAEHKEATILHLGCGLDSRVYRVDPPPSVLWFDVDYPDVIELRRRLYPERQSYQMVGSSLANLEWLESVPRDRPALMVAEGVTMYLTEEIVKAILNRIVTHFPSGQMAFDVHTPQMVRWLTKSGSDIRGTGATFSWGLDAPNDIKQLEPRLELVTEHKVSDMPTFSRLPWRLRADSHAGSATGAANHALLALSVVGDAV